MRSRHDNDLDQKLSISIHFAAHSGNRQLDSSGIQTLARML